MAEPTPPPDGIIIEPQVPVTSSLDDLVAKLKGPAEEILAKPTTEQLQAERVKGVISYIVDISKREDLLKILQAISKAKGETCFIPLIQASSSDGQLTTILRINDQGNVEYNNNFVEPQSPEWKKLKLVRIIDGDYRLEDGSQIPSVSHYPEYLGDFDLIEDNKEIHQGREKSLTDLLHFPGSKSGYDKATRDSVNTTFTKALEAEASSAFNPTQPIS